MCQRRWCFIYLKYLTSSGNTLVSHLSFKPTKISLSANIGLTNLIFLAKIPIQRPLVRDLLFLPAEWPIWACSALWVFSEYTNKQKCFWITGPPPSWTFTYGDKHHLKYLNCIIICPSDCSHIVKFNISLAWQRSINQVRIDWFKIVVSKTIFRKLICLIYISYFN